MLHKQYKADELITLNTGFHMSFCQGDMWKHMVLQGLEVNDAVYMAKKTKV